MSFDLTRLIHLETDIAISIQFRSGKSVSQAFKTLKNDYGYKNICRSTIRTKYEYLEAEMKKVKKKPDSPSDESKSDSNVESTVLSDTDEDTLKYFQTSNAEFYFNMHHKIRGKCIIFNHEELDMFVKKQSNLVFDAIKLREVFKNMGLDTEICHNFTYNKIRNKLYAVSQLDHTNNDCLCIFVLTKKLYPNIICAKDVAYKTERLWKPFINHTTLAGKPKLFFVQVDRNSKIDNRTDLVPYCFPNEKDFLIAHGSIQGFISVKKYLPATRSMQISCDVFDENVDRNELTKTLFITTRKQIQKNKEMPSIMNTMIGVVYFPSEI